MRGRGLLVLVVVAGALLWALRSTQQRAQREDVPTESLLGGRRLFDATRFVFQRAPDLPSLHFTRSDLHEPFMLVEPIVDLASRARLDELRGVLDTAQRFHDAPLSAVTPERLRQMGLDQPRGRIEVRYPDRTFTIRIGLEGPLHQDLYIEMDGSVWRTGLAVWTAIQANPDDMRERLLVQNHPDDIRRLVMQRRIGAANQPEQKRLESVEIVRTGTLDFALVQPLRTAADPTAAAALFSFLSGMVAEQFLTALNPMPEWDVLIEIEGARGIERLTIWQTPQGILGRQEPRNIEFTIESVRYNRTFEVAVDELRARVLVPIPPQDIVRVEIDPGQGMGERIQLRRGPGDAMHLFQPFAMATEPAPINDLLQATQRLRIVEFVESRPAELARFGLDRGFLTVSLHPRLQETQATVLHFGRDEGEHTFVKRSDEPFVAKVPKETVDVLRRAWPAYASRAVALRVPSDANRIRLVVQGAEKAALARGTDGRWQASGRDVTDHAVDMLEILGELRGRRVFDGQEPAIANGLAAARPVQIEVLGASGDGQGIVLHERTGAGDKQAWVVDPRTPRAVVELGPSDSAALLAPLGW